MYLKLKTEFLKNDVSITHILSLITNFLFKKNYCLTLIRKNKNSRLNKMFQYLLLS